MKTDNRHVVITGCSSGIGYCLAKGLKERGYQVIASCRHQKDVDRLIQEGLTGSIRIDLTDEDNINEAVGLIQEISGNNVYGLINNGAFGQPGAMIDMRREVLRDQFETNVFGTQQLTNGLLPLMLQQGTGRVIQISSVLGFVCLRFRGPYNASKYALEAMTDTMRLEHRSSGVYFSLVEPGPITSRFRLNALKKYQDNIDGSGSLFKATYEELEKRLQSTEEIRFTLPPEAVLKATIHAMESRRPRIRYHVTFPTYILAFLKRALSDRWLDAFLHSQSDRLVTRKTRL